jgi:oligopeptide transport system ATP-binding protein
MYAGSIVEQGPVRSVLKAPRHPYTQGLLRTLPNDASPERPLFSIPGSVPSLLQPPTGCAFAPRCEHATEECRREIPRSYAIAPDHEVACFLHRRT